MQKGLEYPREEGEAAHMEELVGYMVANGQLVVSPLIFVRGWLENRIKIFTARNDSGEIVGMTVTPLVEDPITGAHKWWVSFTAGEKLSDIVSESMSIYEALS